MGFRTRSLAWVGFLILSGTVFGASSSYHVSCDASTDRIGGFVPGQPEVTIEADIALTPHLGNDFLCNEAVTARQGQLKFNVVSRATVRVQKADKSGYLVVRTRPTSEFGECDLSPSPVFNDWRSYGILSFYDKDFICQPGRNCGPNQGVVDSSDPGTEWKNFSLGLNYIYDKQGHRQLAPTTSYITLERTGEDGYPADIPYKLNHCTFSK